MCLHHSQPINKWFNQIAVLAVATGRGSKLSFGKEFNSHHTRLLQLPMQSGLHLSTVHQILPPQMLLPNAIQLDQEQRSLFERANERANARHAPQSKGAVC